MPFRRLLGYVIIWSSTEKPGRACGCFENCDSCDLEKFSFDGLSYVGIEGAGRQRCRQMESVDDRKQINSMRWQREQSKGSRLYFEEQSRVFLGRECGKLTSLQWV